MNEFDSYDPISPTFTSMKIKYVDFDNNLTSLNMLKPDDRLNLFISMESIYKNISMIQDLEKKLLLYKDFKISFIANVLNLVAHYKRFFIGNGLNPKIYIYQTDFASDEFPEFKYNEDYRSYYLNKYNGNPKFAYLTDSLKNDILPDLITYCEFIPDVYYINCKNMEGSLVPYIIGNTDPTVKNFIISSDIFDTQYLGIPNYSTHFINRFGKDNKYIMYKINDIIDYLAKDASPDELEYIISTIKPYHIYCGFLATNGEKQRSIDSISGVGISGYTKIINNGYNTNEITKDVSNPEMIGKVFHNIDAFNEFINNYYCTCIEYMYKSLTQAHLSHVLNQISDRSDVNSLVSLNATKFSKHPILLEYLV